MLVKDKNGIWKTKTETRWLTKIEICHKYNLTIPELNALLIKHKLLKRHLISTKLPSGEKKYRIGVSESNDTMTVREKMTFFRKTSGTWRQGSFLLNETKLLKKGILKCF